MPNKKTDTEPKAAMPLETVAETADQLHVSERTVWRLIADGDLPVVRFGGTVRVRPEDREAFIRKHLS